MPEEKPIGNDGAMEMRKNCIARGYEISRKPQGKTMREGGL